MIFEGFIKKMAEQPKQLFLLDGIGAVLSAFSLGVILIQFKNYFGMPREELFFLALAACFFAAYSLFCYVRTPKNWRPFLRFIAIVNLVYCCITIGLVVLFQSKLTILGMIYFILELIIIIVLVSLEFKIASIKTL